MALYTTTGDHGDTSLLDGTRVRKNHHRIHAYGDVDELNALLGWCRCAADGLLADRLANVQRDLFHIGAELATPADSKRPIPVPLIESAHWHRLERWIDEACDQSRPLRNFILPGGGELAARLHLARTGCRRAEREIVALMVGDKVREDVLVYLNRLSDMLFAWARLANHQAGCDDEIWTSST